MTNAVKPNEAETNEQAESRELFCGCCGYGVVVRHDPPDCPMCRSSSWSVKPGFARWN